MCRERAEDVDQTLASMIQWARARDARLEEFLEFRRETYAEEMAKWIEGDESIRRFREKFFPKAEEEKP